MGICVRREVERKDGSILLSPRLDEGQRQKINPKVGRWENQEGHTAVALTFVFSSNSPNTRIVRMRGTDLTPSLWGQCLYFLELSTVGNQ